MKKSTILIIIFAVIGTCLLGYLVLMAISAPTILGTLNRAQKNTCKNQFLFSVDGLKTQLAFESYGESKIDFNWDENKTVEMSYNEINKLFDSDVLIAGSIIITKTPDGHKFILSNLATDICKVEGDIDSDKLTSDDIVKNK